VIGSVIVVEYLDKGTVTKRKEEASKGRQAKEEKAMKGEQKGRDGNGSERRK
jgi:hypothetical protein